MENATSSLEEERANKKKMEMWFKRRLDAIEYHIIDLQSSPHEDKKFDKLLNKVRRLKQKQPWNNSKKPNLVLDEAALNQKSDIYSNGTSTPFSHYVCVLSSAASENNLLDKGFLGTNNNSHPGTQKSQNSFLSGPLSQSIDKSKQVFIESMVRKLQDSRVSLSDKEKLFCDVFRRSPANSALMHVRLEDIMNAANVSKSIDSLSLDLKMNSDKSKGTFKFNQKMKLDDLKDTKLEKAISTIQSQGSLKSSGLFGGTFRRSKSLADERALLFGSPEKNNLEQLIGLNMPARQREGPSDLDKGIIQELSAMPEQFQDKESEHSLAFLQRMLSPKNRQIFAQE